jgi:hypothetical protein
MRLRRRFHISDIGPAAIRELLERAANFSEAIIAWDDVCC